MSIRTFVNANQEDVRVEEVEDANGETICYKQWNNGILIIHREWEMANYMRTTLFNDVLENYWSRTSYHKFKDFEISNTWNSKGGWSRHYIKLSVDFTGYIAISRLVSENYDTGFTTKTVNTNVNYANYRA